MAPKAPPAAGPLRAGASTLRPRTRPASSRHAGPAGEEPGVMSCWRFSFPSHHNVPAAPHEMGWTGT